MADKCTALAVIDDAIVTLGKRNGYTPDMYWGVKYKSDYPGDSTTYFRGADRMEEATTFCAIGGIEHAIWKLCNADAEELREKRDTIAYVGGENEYDVSGRTAARNRMRKPALRVYIDVMGVLNRVAQSKPFQRFEVESIEGLTGSASKRTVMKAFRAARDEIAARP